MSDNPGKAKVCSNPGGAAPGSRTRSSPKSPARRPGRWRGVLMIAKATRTAGERVSRSAARYTPRLNFVSRFCRAEARKFAAHPERRTCFGKAQERQDVTSQRQTLLPLHGSNSRLHLKTAGWKRLSSYVTLLLCVASNYLAPRFCCIFIRVYYILLLAFRAGEV